MEEEEDEDSVELTPENLRSALEMTNNLRQRGAQNLKLDLSGASLRGFDLEDLDLSTTILANTDLSYAKLPGAILKGVDLSRAKLTETKLQNANLEGAHLVGAYLYGTNLYKANLQNCNLTYACIVGAGFAFADLSGAQLKAANFVVVNMTGACFRKADLLFTSFNGAELNDADFEEAKFSQTILAASYLEGVKGLEKVRHDGPCSIDSETLRNAAGIPEQFLRGIGLSDWEVLQFRLYKALTTSEIQQIYRELLGARLRGRAVRIFISYSHLDSKFALKLSGELRGEGFIVWLDEHELEAGPLQHQIRSAIIEQDVVIIVLSKHSVESDWVENELDIARSREKSEKIDLLCPVAIDDAWEGKLNAHDLPNQALWRRLRDKYVIDFSKWRTKRFQKSFIQLVSGLRKNYTLTDSDTKLPG